MWRFLKWCLGILIPPKTESSCPSLHSFLPFSCSIAWYLYSHCMLKKVHKMQMAVEEGNLFKFFQGFTWREKTAGGKSLGDGESFSRREGEGDSSWDPFHHTFLLLFTKSSSSFVGFRWWSTTPPWFWWQFTVLFPFGSIFPRLIFCICCYTT